MNAQRILLVEDNEFDIELARLAFAASGYADEVDVARDGQEALDYLEDRLTPGAPHHRPALVLLDLNMPRVSGHDLLVRLKGNPAYRDVPVVVLTTSDEAIDRDQCARLGVEEYRRKPFDFDEFVETVGQITARWLGGAAPYAG
jgi:CheY-like chemotaxis protein